MLVVGIAVTRIGALLYSDYKASDRLSFRLNCAGIRKKLMNVPYLSWVKMTKCSCLIVLSLLC